MNKLRQLILILMTALIGLSGCAAPPATVSPRTVAAPLESTATALPTVRPSPTPPICPPRQDVAFPPAPSAFAEYEATLLQFLNDGGDPLQLEALLGSWQAALTNGPKMLQTDLTHDGIPETVVVAGDPHSTQVPPLAQLFIFTCAAGQMQRLYAYQPGEWFGLELVGALDMTQDGQDDLIFAEVSCGASTCWDIMHIWTWQGKDFVEQAPGDLFVPYARFVMEDQRLLIINGGMGSVGAGPQRAITLTVAWDGTVITTTAITVAPATYRYHAFVDGEEALSSGDYATAHAFFRQVIADETLQEWAAIYTADEESLWLSALAYWRLATLEALRGDQTAAAAVMAELRAAYPVGMPAQPVVDLAEHFWQVYPQSGDVNAACAAVASDIGAQTVVDFLNSFGYANLEYMPETVCLRPAQ